MRLKRYLWLLMAAVAVLASCTQKATVSTAPPSAVSGQGETRTAEQLLSEAEDRFAGKDYAGALEIYNAFIRVYPDHDMVPLALMKTGAAYRALGDYERSRKAYETVIAKYPGHYLVQEAHVELLATYYYEGRFDVVVTHLAPTLAVVTQEDLRLRINLLAGDAYMALDAPSDAALAYVQAYLKADENVRSELRQRLSSALRLLDRDAFNTLLSRIPDADMQQMVAALGRTLIYKRGTIGCLLPLSGAFQMFGQRALNGIQLAVAETSGAYPSVSLIVKDTGGDDARATAAVAELAEAGVAAIVGPIAAADAAAEAAQSLGVPIITLTQREGITGRGSFVFRNFITPQMQTEALVSYAVTALGARRFAILYPKDSYGRTFMDLFWDEVIHQGATVAAVAPYDGDKTDFTDPVKKIVGLDNPADPQMALALRPVLTSTPERLTFADYGGHLIGLYYTLPEAFYPPAPTPVEAMAPSLLWATADRQEATEPVPIIDFDAIFIPDAPRTAGLIIPQLAYHDISGPVLLGTNLWHSDELVKMSRNYVQGAIFPDGFFAESRQPTVQRFVAAFTSIYEETPGFIEAISYDSAKLLLEIMTRPSIHGRADIRDALLKTADFQGVTGVTAFDYDGEVRKQPFLLTIRGSRLDEITNAFPAAAPVDAQPQ